jgi:hypothetical protein
MLINLTIMAALCMYVPGKEGVDCEEVVGEGRKARKGANMPELFPRCQYLPSRNFPYCRVHDVHVK